MNNPAQVFLEDLRRMVAEHYPGVKVVQSDSAYRIGEDRYEFARGVSLYVQAPVWPTGGPRKGLRFWRHTAYCKPPRWTYVRHVLGVYRAIVELAEREGHRETRRGQGGVP
ncbi:MAG: hypothetical protein OXF27_01995 [Acidobacteria bacterium]|nr:hypothetical protein [Acidobacteriota bacterium]